jgi:hypothetical protein
MTAKCADCKTNCAKTYVESCARIYPIRCETVTIIPFLLYACVCQDEDSQPRHSGAAENCL